jgi:DNA repair protein RadA/Sms
VPHDIVVFGEIALSGRIRPVAHADARLKEAAKLGFAEAWVPALPSRSRKAGAGDGLKTAPIEHLSELVALLSPSPRRRDPSQDAPRRPSSAGASRIMVTR